MVSAIGAPADQIALAPPPPAPASNRAISDEEKQQNSFQGKDFNLFGKDGFTFFDFLDIINPLQHIPVVSTIYRSLTGDQIDPGAKIAGSALFGGPFGAALASLDVAVEHGTGKDIADHAVAFFSGNVGKPGQPDTPPANQTVQVAGLTPAAAGKAHIPLNPTESRVYNAYAGPVRITEPYAAGMSRIPVAKDSDVYKQQQAAAVYTAHAAPDLGLLADINKTTVSLEETAAKNDVPTAAAIQTQHVKKLVETGAMELQPKDFLNPEAAKAFLQKPEAAIQTQDKLAAVQNSMASAKKNWIMNSMLGALDKYQASAKLGLSPAQPALSVVR